MCQNGSVVGGVPAKIIGKYDDLKKKNLIEAEKYVNLGKEKTVENMSEYIKEKFDIEKEMEIKNG